MDEQVMRAALAAQRNEITEHHIYSSLARSTRDPNNSEVLRRISRDELRHYRWWRERTGRDAKPSLLKIWFHTLVARLFGLTFGIKLMEKGEGRAETNYRFMASSFPEVADIAAEEDEHEAELINMLDEDRLKYMGAVVLGLNDALVELTGALAGFTFVLGNPRAIAVVGLITGLSAALSMAGSQYLATKSEGGALKPGKASLMTGLAYCGTVVVLIAPYLVIGNVYWSLGLMLLLAMLTVSLFNFYTAVAQDLPFLRRFLEMAGISLGIATLTFCIGALIRHAFPIDV